MTDSSTADTLAQVRLASVAGMSKTERADYLRSRGWRMLNGCKQQRWMAPNGLTATLPGDCQIQLLADLEAP
jgi:hypothetical protein